MAKKAVVYGSGKIGRGFIGKKLALSGYEVCFLDKVQELVDALNAKGRYTVRVVTNQGHTDDVIPVAGALNSLTDAAIDVIAGCDIMATAVGVGELPNIAPVIARAMAERMAQKGGPLDVILCENLLDADKQMRGWIGEHQGEGARAWTDANLGLIEASISCMVPPLTPEVLAEDRLLVRVDPSTELAVDSAAFKGAIPRLDNIVPYTPFEFYMRRKLFLNNGSHALCAYLGYQKGYEYIWQAIEDPDIRAAALASMQANADALVAKYGEGVRDNVEAYIDDLLTRFPNRALNDTVTRVGADPARKLRRGDRIVGAALFALEQGVDPAPIVKNVLAALRFDPPEDPTAPAIQAALSGQGIDYVIQHYMQLSTDEPLYEMIKTEWQKK